MLTDGERDQLTRWARRAKSSQALALRSKIVLACAEGLPSREVAGRLGAHEDTVGKWRRRFLAQRLDGLADEDRPGRPPSITLDQVEDVLVATLEQVPAGATHWSRASMARKAGLSKSTIGRIWRDFGLKPHLTDGFKLSSDPLFTEKVVDVVGLYHDPPERAVVLCVDEKSQIQAYPDPAGAADDARHAAPPAPGDRVQEVPHRHRQGRPCRAGRPPDRDSSTDSQDPGDQGLAGPASPLPHAFHAPPGRLDQPGRAVVRLVDRPDGPAQRPTRASRPSKPTSAPGSTAEPEPEAIRVEEDRRGNPRLPRTILPTNFRRRTLAAGPVEPAHAHGRRRHRRRCPSCRLRRWPGRCRARGAGHLGGDGRPRRRPGP